MIADITKFITANRSSLDLVLDLVPIPLFVKDREGRYLDCNIAFTEFLHISREQIIGKTAHDLWRKEEADVFARQDAALFESTGLQVYETEITSSKGLTFIVQFHKRTFTDAQGVVQGFLGAIFDITERRRYVTELEEAINRVRSLEGLLPICAWCRRMREEDDTWVPLERFIGARTSASFTHAICPDCAGKLSVKP